MDKYTVITVKVPREVFEELALRIPEGERSTFIREAILEKLQQVPRPDKIRELEQKIKSLEVSLSEIKKCLTELEVVAFTRDNVNIHEYGLDEADHKILDYLLHYKGATTPELATYLKINRWQILNRLRRIQKRSQKQLGKSIIEYYAGERSGKKRAWWINQELIGI